MIDFHCHVLMGIDDGSRNLETSASMLEASKAQGVQQIVCTPHFDATKDRMEEFLITGITHFKYFRNGSMRRTQLTFGYIRLQRSFFSAT